MSLQGAKDFGRSLYVLAMKMGVERAMEVVFIGDGSKWIWDLAEEHFYQAVQVVDFWHASERIWEVSRWVWGKGEEKGCRWAMKWEKKLKGGK